MDTYTNIHTSNPGLVYPGAVSRQPGESRESVMYSNLKIVFYNFILNLFNIDPQYQALN